MTLAEFKAWLDGYRHSFANGHPSADQWSVIKQQIDKLAVVNSGGQNKPAIWPVLPDPMRGPRYDTTGIDPNYGLPFAT